MSKLPKQLPCPLCQGRMSVYYDREVYRNVARCACCGNTIDLRWYKATAQSEYKKRIAQMGASQKNIISNK